MPPRGLDHIVHAVRDLDAAADLYARLGFLVGARNRHPWGTHNRLVQLPGFFIELLTVAEPDRLGDDGFSQHFGVFNQKFLQEREGLSMLLLESADPAQDAAELSHATIAAAESLHFEREGKRPDGSAVTVGFTLTFAHDVKSPEVGFAVCHHHAPENFWNIAFHDHANTARAIAGAVLVADNPSDHHLFLSALVGERELLETSSGLTVATPRGEVQIMSPEAFGSHFGVTGPNISHGARLAALRIGVREMDAVTATLHSGKVPFQSHRGRVIVGRKTAHGATLIFEPA
jgi:catechol 2,3-dioxygenase-like lactoylglutathione lyase family enzyme